MELANEKIVKAASEKQVYSLLGLCARQGAVKSGEFLADQAIKEKKAFLIIIAEDASENTKKGFKDACEFYKVKFRIFGSKDKLGHSIGREMRATAAVCNSGLAEKITETIDELTDASLRAEGTQEG